MKRYLIWKQLEESKFFKFTNANEEAIRELWSNRLERL